MPFLLCVALLGAGLLVYSQTAAFAWDEGFHLLAAQSIASGRTPYLDFIFAQTPLNAYWNGAWIRLFGFSWRGIHAVTALLTLAAVVLAADFLRTRFRIPGWQNAAMITALLLSGSNLMIVEFGTIGQAYGLALFLTVAAFRAAVLAEESGRAGWSALAGLLSAAAAGSTLLTAPVAPVLLLWIVYYTWARGWMKHVVLFAAGAIAALSPILILLARSPGQVVFDIFKYHIFYRRSGWEGATQHDLSVLTGWIDFPQAIILGIFAAAGLWFVMRRSGWDRARRAEFYLCGWISLGIAVHVSTAHPTFERYYLFTVPFLSILCAAGIYAFAAQMGAEKAFWPVAGVLALALLGLGKALYEARDDTSWDDLQKVAMEVQRVTPPGAMLYADEHVYFLDRLRPPPGNEYLSSHLLDLPAPLSATQHIVPQAEWDREIAAGKFSTVETCEAEDWIEERKLTLLYKQKTEVSGCNVFWDRAGASVNSPGR